MRRITLCEKKANVDIHVYKLAYSIILSNLETGRKALISNLSSVTAKQVKQIMNNHIEIISKRIAPMNEKQAKKELENMSCWLRERVLKKIEKVKAVAKKEV